MAAKSNLVNMLVCLTAVCLVCSALLAVTYAVTAGPIATSGQEKTALTIAKVLPDFSVTPELKDVSFEGNSYSYYEVPGSGRAFLVTTSGFGGPLTVMVGIDTAGNIWNTMVISHNETPGLGAKCRGEKFSGQFRGWNPAEKKLVVKKDGGDVDAITASTITSRAYTLALDIAVRINETLGGQDNE